VEEREKGEGIRYEGSFKLVFEVEVQTTSNPKKWVAALKA
jgi:hypothetical protein